MSTRIETTLRRKGRALFRKEVDAEGVVTWPLVVPLCSSINEAKRLSHRHQKANGGLGMGAVVVLPRNSREEGGSTS